MDSSFLLANNLPSITNLEFTPQDLDELPAFEEAFNQDNLRQFFKSSESHSRLQYPSKIHISDKHSMFGLSTDHSPLKDHLSDDAQYSVAETNDTSYMSPQRESSPNGKEQILNHQIRFSLNLNEKAKNLAENFQMKNTLAKSYVDDTIKINTNEVPIGVVTKENNLQNNNNNETKKKVFLIIKNSVPTPKQETVTFRFTNINVGMYSKNALNKGEVSKEKKKTPKNMKSNQSNNNTPNTNTFTPDLFNYMNTYQNLEISTPQSSGKRDTSCILLEEPPKTKKLKGEKILNQISENPIDFTFDIGADFNPADFDILPTIDFDDLFNKNY